jgi:hypothetical protein
LFVDMKMLTLKVFATIHHVQRAATLRLSIITTYIMIIKPIPFSMIRYYGHQALYS